MLLSLSHLRVFNVDWLLLLLLFWLMTVVLFGSCERPTFSCGGTDPGSVTEFLETHPGITEHIWTGWGRVAGFKAWILHTDTSLLLLTLKIQESSCASRPRPWKHWRASHFSQIWFQNRRAKLRRSFRESSLQVIQTAVSRYEDVEHLRAKWAADLEPGEAAQRPAGIHQNHEGCLSWFLV